MFKELGDYGLTCQHPRRVFNKYIKDWIVVPCGHCAACAATRSNRVVSMVSNASRSASVTYFLTLTYSPCNLPWCQFSLEYGNIVTSSIVHNWRYRSRRPVVSSYDTHVPLDDVDLHFFSKGMPSISDSSYLGTGRFGVLVKSDLQKFFKRFRKLFNYAFPTYYFKYLAIGEYGTQTFRPHYHVALFVDNVLPFVKLQSILSLSWKLGIVDCQVSTGSVASYLGSYLGSSSSFPSFLGQKFCRPFVIHSAFSAYALTPSQEKSYFKRAYFDCITRIVCETPVGFALLPYPRSMRSKLFPKCSRFYTRTRSTLHKVLQRFGNEVLNQHTVNPRFRVAVVVDVFRDNTIGINTDDVVEYDYLTLSQIRDAYLDDDDKRKKVHGYRLLDKRDYVDIYSSYKVHKIAVLLHTSEYFVSKRILDYYLGSADDFGDNYQLQLLAMQYNAFELCDNDDEVKFLYSLFNGPSTASSLRASGYDDVSISPAVYAHLNDVVSSTLIIPIKHKERNSYIQYKLHH